jgi:hypothetical protein
MNENDEDDDGFVNGDYGFVIGPDGELKSVMFPEDLMEDPPKAIQKILKIFGIKDIHAIVEQTMH